MENKSYAACDKAAQWSAPKERSLGKRRRKSKAFIRCLKGCLSSGLPSEEKEAAVPFQAKLQDRGKQM